MPGCVEPLGSICSRARGLHRRVLGGWHGNVSDCGSLSCALGTSQPQAINLTTAAHRRAGKRGLLVIEPPALAPVAPRSAPPPVMACEFTRLRARVPDLPSRLVPGGRFSLIAGGRWNGGKSASPQCHRCHREVRHRAQDVEPACAPSSGARARPEVIHAEAVKPAVSTNPSWGHHIVHLDDGRRVPMLRVAGLRLPEEPAV